MTRLRLALLAVSLALGATAAWRHAHAPARLPAALDVHALMRQVHFAWRAEGGVWRSEHHTWSAELDGDTLRFTPRAHDAGDAVEFGPARVRRAAYGLLDAGGAERPGGAAAGRVDATRNDGPGGAALPDVRGRVRPRETGGLDIERGGFTEALSSAEAGVEQSWRFAAAPAGEGELVVEVPVRRGRFLGATGDGLHFTGGALAVRYGHGTWVDAKGRRTPVPARFEAGAIVLAVPQEVLDLSAWPAVLDPVIGPEFSVGDAIPSEAWTSTGQPDVASDGSNFLVVWEDGRSGPGGDIYGARVTGAGSVLDAAGIAICTQEARQSDPRVAWDGSSYVVVWTDGRGADEDVYATRVTTGGVVRDLHGFVVSQAPGSQRAPAIAGTGTGSFVAWVDGRNGPDNDDIYGARLNTSAVVLDAAGIAIATAAGHQTSPTVAWDGTNALVAFEDMRNGQADIFANRVGPSGALLDGAGLAVYQGVGAQRQPAAGFTGSSFVVAWRDERNGNADVYAGRVSTTGVAMDPVGIAVALGAGDQTSPAVARAGTNVVVTYLDGADGSLKARRLNGSGALLDAQPVPLATGAAPGRPSLAFSSTNGLLAWDEHPAHGRIRARLVTPSLMTPGTPTTVSTAPNTQRHPAIAFGDFGALVVWEDARAGNWDVYGARLSPAGVVLDPAGIAIATSAEPDVQPAVAWNGADFLVVWQRGGSATQIAGARVSAAGALLDATPLVISADGLPREPRVAAAGSTFLVAWARGAGGISAARVDGAGAVLDPQGIPVCTAPGSQATPDVAFDGADWLVAWVDTRGRADGGAGSDIYATRVSPAGVVMDPNGVLLSSGAGTTSFPALARLGAGALAAWCDDRGGPLEVYGTRVLAGAPLDPAGVFLAPSGAADGWCQVAAAWDGTDALLAWTTAAAGSRNTDIEGQLVSPAGQPAGAATFTLANRRVPESQPAVACDGRRQCLVLWERFDETPAVQAVRLSARTVTKGSAPVATAQSVTLDEDVPTVITLAGADADGDALGFTVVELPAHGTLSGAPPAVTYTPFPDYNGPDRFTFKASDGLLESAPAAVSLTVRPVNDAPSAMDLNVVLPQDTPVTVTLRGTDVDGDALSFALATQPRHGVVSGSGASVQYTPAAGYVGADSFTYTASDGTATSPPATVSLTITPGTAGGGGGGATGGGPGRGSIDAGAGGGTGGGSPAGGCGCTSGAGWLSVLGGSVWLGLRRRPIARGSRDANAPSS